MVSDPKQAVRTAWLDGQTIARQANQAYHRLQGPPSGYDLMAADWDTAIILDSCRYDAFIHRTGLQRGTLSRETAPGSHSREFMEHCFQGRELHDTVYVTANPFVSILDDETFHRVYFDEIDDNVGDGRVGPKPVTKTAIEARRAHP